MHEAWRACAEAHLKHYLLTLSRTLVALGFNQRSAASNGSLLLDFDRNLECFLRICPPSALR